jgi:hypothetical protein
VTALAPRKLGAYVQVSRELLLDAERTKPTPAERAEYERREAERKAALDVARTALDAITDQPARAVLDLHCENELGECTGDDADGYDWMYVDWPCRTVVTIAEHYGIALP